MRAWLTLCFLCVTACTAGTIEVEDAPDAGGAVDEGAGGAAPSPEPCRAADGCGCCFDRDGAIRCPPGVTAPDAAVLTLPVCAPRRGAVDTGGHGP